MPFDFVPPEQFFDLLYNDVEFCEGLGKVMLAASKLETDIRKYLKARNITFQSKSTLGNLVNKLIENNLLSKNAEEYFKDLALKRNYLAHSLYDLFTKEIEETILERDELTAVDTDVFISRAYDLADSFLSIAEIISRKDIASDKLLR